MMKIYYDTSDDTTLIALKGGIGPGETARMVDAFGGLIYLHLDKAGRLIAVELFDPYMLHPDLAKDAIQMRPIEEGDL